MIVTVLLFFPDLQPSPYSTNRRPPLSYNTVVLTCPARQPTGTFRYHMYTHLHTHTHAIPCIHVHAMYVRIYKHIHICRILCINVRTYITYISYICRYIIYVHTYIIHIYIHMYIHYTHTHTHVHTHTHTHTHTYVHTHTHTHKKSHYIQFPLMHSG
jgi:hypothetical protein